MGMLKRLMNKAKGIDPFFEEVKAEQIGLYQHYFIKVLQSIDVDVETSWSMGKPYDKERFQKDGRSGSRRFNSIYSSGDRPSVLFCGRLSARNRS
jgi:hypothetical protein